MTDAQLHEALGAAQSDEAGIMAAMELLETQAQLRDIEKMEFAAWVMDLETNGSPEALLAVQNAKRAQQGLEPVDYLIPATPAVEDVVAGLNALYAKPASETADELQPQLEVEIQPEVEPEVEHEVEPEALPVTEAVIEREPLVEYSEQAAFDENLRAQLQSQDFDTLLAGAAEVSPAAKAPTALEVESFLDSEATDESIELNKVAQPLELAEPVSLHSEPRASRRSLPISQFWAWLGLGGSILPLGLAVAISQFDISFLQGAFAIAAGTAASALAIAIAALSGKRSGLATAFLSRAPFGVFGNIAPAAFLLLTRIFWSVAIVWFVLQVSTRVVSSDQKVIEPSAFIAPVAISILAAILAFFGGKVLFKIQQISGLVGLVAGATIVGFTASGIAWNDLLLEVSGSWVSTFAAMGVVFSVFGVAWSGSGADFARKLSSSSLGFKVVGWALLSLAIVPAAIGIYGYALIRGMRGFGPTFDEQFAANFVSALATNSNVFVAIFLLASAVISSVVMLAMSNYSLNLVLHALSIKMKPLLGQIVIAVLVVGGAFSFGLFVASESALKILIDYALALAIPVSAWIGIYTSDVLIRRIAYHEISLTRGYGFYKAVNLANLIGWALAVAVGWGLISSNQPGLTWLGYLTAQLPSAGFWSATNFGIIIALALGLLLPVALGIPRIKRQEAEVLAIEARRDELKNMFEAMD